MSISFCNGCDNYIDLDFNAEHFEEEAMSALMESGLTEDEAERQLEDYDYSELMA